jgi:hypothetical protein
VVRHLSKQQSTLPAGKRKDNFEEYCTKGFQPSSHRLLADAPGYWNLNCRAMPTAAPGTGPANRKECKLKDWPVHARATGQLDFEPGTGGSGDVMCGGFQQGEQARAGSNRPMRALPSLEPAGEGLIVEAVELGELRSAQAAGVVGRQQDGALVGGEAEL